MAGRGINIDSLVVARTEVDDLSRMTIVINGQDEKIEQARKQLEGNYSLVRCCFLIGMPIDIVPVWAVLDYTKQRTVDREMLLVKVATVPHEFENEDQTDIEVFACVTNLSMFTPLCTCRSILALLHSHHSCLLHYSANQLTTSQSYLMQSSLMLAWTALLWN